MNPSPTLLLLALATMASACTSDGQLGDSGQVRFSQIVHFAESDDFESPIATGSSVLVALQDPDTDSLFADGDTDVDLTFGVKSANGKELPVFALGFAQYVFALPESGNYTMHALDGTAPIDSLAVYAEPMADIRLATDTRVTTSGSDCSRVETVDPDNFVLHPNQSFETQIVPVSATGEPMVGLLSLTASGSSSLSFDSQLVGHGAMGNSLRIAPVSTMNPEVRVNVRELENEMNIAWDVPTSSAPKQISCD